MKLQEYLSMDNEAKFQYFMDTRFKTNRTPAYWVNWDNVISNMQEHELNLNTLNYLVGKVNIRKHAEKLFKNQPQLLKSIPILLASRDLEMDVLAFDDLGKMYSYDINFKSPNLERLEDYLNFIEETGLFNFLQKNLKQSLVDYVFGVQTGLDSNGRKNRSGTQNEDILERNLAHLLDSNKKLQYKTQATANYISENWGIVVPEALEEGKKGGRRYDGAVYNPDTNMVTVIETNFYGGGGSKLKAVSGEFSDIYRNSLETAPNVNFVWISDGPGWNTAKNPMREAFDAIPTIINLSMVQDGVLDEIVNGGKITW